LNHSDDYPTPAASFTGDETGAIFDAPDVVRQSPTTNERVVDTQSGYLVVIKRAETKIAISLKRRIGTPPSSAIILTPDESIKLSAILADLVAGLTGKQLSPRKVQTSVEDWIGKVTAQGSGGGATGTLDPQTGDVEQDDDAEEQPLHAEFSAFSALQRQTRAKRKKSVPNRNLKIAVGITGVAIVGLLGFIGMNALGSKPATPAVASVVAQPGPLDDSIVDKFARGFVSDMLDFSPETYKVSQIQAMSHMSAPVLDKYWTETNFPLPKKQLNSLPQGQTVMITKVTQERSSAEEKDVDIFAELVSANSKISNPVHLKLKLALTPDNQIKVGNMQDLSGKK
jgi:hypothetical protein